MLGPHGPHLFSGRDFAPSDLGVGLDEVRFLVRGKLVGRLFLAHDLQDGARHVLLFFGRQGAEPVNGMVDEAGHGPMLAQAGAEKHVSFRTPIFHGADSSFRFGWQNSAETSVFATRLADGDDLL